MLLPNTLVTLLLSLAPLVTPSPDPAPDALSVRSPVNDAERLKTSDEPPPPRHSPRPREDAQRYPLKCRPHRLDVTNSHLPLQLRLSTNRCESIYDCRDHLMKSREVLAPSDPDIWKQCEEECTCEEQPPPGPRLETKPSVPASNPTSGHRFHSLSIRTPAKTPKTSQRPPRPPLGPQRPQATKTPKPPPTLQSSRVQEGILRCKPHRIDWQSSHLQFATIRCEEILQCIGLDPVQIRGSYDPQIWRQCMSLCECKPQAPMEAFPLYMAPDPTFPPVHAAGASRHHHLLQRSPAPESDRTPSSSHALAIRSPASDPPRDGAASLASTGDPQSFANDRPRRLFTAPGAPPPPPAQRWSLECAPHSLDWQRSSLRLRAERCGDVFSCFGSEMTQVRGDYDVRIQQQCERECRCRIGDGGPEGAGAGAGTGTGQRRRGRDGNGNRRGRGQGLGSPVQGVS